MDLPDEREPPLTEARHQLHAPKRTVALEPFGQDRAHRAAKAGGPSGYRCGHLRYVVGEREPCVVDPQRIVQPRGHHAAAEPRQQTEPACDVVPQVSQARRLSIEHEGPTDVHGCGVGFEPQERLIQGGQTVHWQCPSLLWGVRCPRRDRGDRGYEVTAKCGKIHHHSGDLPCCLRVVERTTTARCAPQAEAQRLEIGARSATSLRSDPSLLKRITTIPPGSSPVTTPSPNVGWTTSSPSL
jgi:hypothetical protein